MHGFIQTRLTLKFAVVSVKYTKGSIPPVSNASASDFKPNTPKTIKKLSVMSLVLIKQNCQDRVELRYAFNLLNYQDKLFIKELGRQLSGQ
jgi:hypothetical protein